MWLHLVENMSHVVAFALAAHNANVPLFSYDLSAAFNVPKEYRRKPQED